MAFLTRDYDSTLGDEVVDQTEAPGSLKSLPWCTLIQILITSTFRVILHLPGVAEVPNYCIILNGANRFKRKTQNSKRYNPTRSMAT